MTAATTRQMARYALTGGTAALVDIGLFHILIVLGGAVVASAAASFLVAAGVNYLLTSAFVFQAGRRTARQGMAFLCTASLGFILNTGLTAALHACGLVPTLAKAIAVGIVFFFNFFANRLLVFRTAA